VTPAIIFALVALLVGAGLLLRSPSWASTGLFAMLLGSIAGMGILSLGQPKPVWAGCNLTKESTVLAFSLDEGRAVYLWLQTDGAPPLSCALPWDEKQAAQINSAAEDAKAQGVPLKIQMKGAKPGQPGTKDDEKPLAYPAPVPPLPPKQGS
jgi:hypothetical protein